MSHSVRPHRRQPTRLPCPWNSPGKNKVGCHFLLQCMKVKSESEVAQSCPTLSDPMDYSLQAPPSVGFSRQEYWSGVPLPSPQQPHSRYYFIHFFQVRKLRCRRSSAHNPRGTKPGFFKIFKFFKKRARQAALLSLWVLSPQKSVGMAAAGMGFKTRAHVL